MGEGMASSLVVLLVTRDAFLKGAVPELVHRAGWRCLVIADGEGEHLQEEADVAVIDFADTSGVGPTLAGVPGVGIVASSEPENVMAALRWGAHAVVSRHCHPHDLLRAVQAAVHGQCLIPDAALRTLVLAAPPERPAVELDDHEVRWLAMLAEGRSIPALAAAVGYSERAMFRLLAALYARMGARNRVEALIIATRAGLDLLRPGDGGMARET